MAHLRQRADLDEPPVAQDADPVAQRLDLAEDVRGQEHRLAARRGPRATQWRNACSISGSSPLVGSSSISRSARVISAAIRISFWRLPFE